LSRTFVDMNWHWSHGVWPQPCTFYLASASYILILALDYTCSYADSLTLKYQTGFSVCHLIVKAPH